MTCCRCTQSTNSWLCSVHVVVITTNINSCRPSSLSVATKAIVLYIHLYTCTARALCRLGVFAFILVWRTIRIPCQSKKKRNETYKKNYRISLLYLHTHHVSDSVLKLERMIVWYRHVTYTPIICVWNYQKRFLLQCDWNVKHKYMQK